MIHKLNEDSTQDVKLNIWKGASCEMIDYDHNQYGYLTKLEFDTEIGFVTVTCSEYGMKVNIQEK